MSREHSTYLSPSVVDLGDVFCVPHYLSEDMLSEEQRSATQAVMYGGSQSTKECLSLRWVSLRKYFNNCTRASA